MTKQLSTFGIFKYIKAAAFFRTYAPGVLNFKRKMTGTLEWSEQDLDQIRKGTKLMAEQLKYISKVI